MNQKFFFIGSNLVFRFMALSGCLILLLGLSGYAAPVRYENPDFLIDNWQASDGLPDNSVFSIAQTPDGYLWLGTFSGLIRFDGVDFEAMKNQPGFPDAGDSIMDLHVGGGGRLWVASERAIIVLEKGHWRVVAKFEATVSIRTMAEDAAGKLWVGTHDGRLLTPVGEGLQPATNAPPLFRSGVFCYRDRQDGAVWLANRSFIGRLTAEGWKPVGLQVADRKPLVVAPAQAGGLWVYQQADGKLIRLKSDGGRVEYPAPSVNEIRKLYEDRDGMIWLASALTGVVRWWPGDEKVGATLTIQNGLANNVALNIAEDSEGNIWLGTGGGGLHRLTPRRFHSIGLGQGLPNPIVRSVSEEFPGRMLVGTHGGGMARVENDRVISVHCASNALASASQFIWSVFRDSNDRVLIGTYNGGLLIETNGAEKVFPGWTPNLGRTVHTLFKDSRGQLWAGTESALVLIGTKKLWPWSPQLDAVPLNVNVRGIAENPRTGEMWIGTFYNGLLRMANGQVSRALTNAATVKNSRISSVFVDDDGCVWAGLYRNGLVCIRNGQIITFNRSNGLPADTIGSMLDDGLGNFWLGSSAGVLRVSKDTIHRTLTQPQPRFVCDVFDRSDGMISAECSEGFQPTAVRDHAGKLWFATQKGVVSVDPKFVRLNRVAPPVVVREVTFKNLEGVFQTVSNLTGQKIQIPAGAAEVRVACAALSYTAPEKVRYACALTGPRQSWAVTNQFRTQVYHALPPGEYRLEVRAANNDGVWNEQPAELIFSIAPFYWQTRWFWSVVIAGVAALIGFAGWRLARAQLRRQLEQLQFQRERMRLAAVMETTSDLVVFTDEQRNILHINPAGQRLLGLDATTVGRLSRFSDLYPGSENRRMEQEAIPAAQKEGTWQGETFLRTTHGREIPVSQVIIVNQDATGRINFISAVARDISERRQAEERQARLEEQLRQSQKMEAVGQLSGGVAHDFNNLLAVITGNVSLLEVDHTLLPDQREALSEVKLATERAAALTRQLLAFSRRQTMQMRNVDLNGLVENMSKMFRRVLGEDIRLMTHFVAEPMVVKMDAGMIEQVLLNLIVNARDAMPTGGDLSISIRVEVLDEGAATKMVGARTGEFVVLQVRDNGRGIAPEILPRIFEPFFTTKDVGKGTGLGLATVYGIVQQHQGWVVVQSRVREGSSFEIYLPRTRGIAEGGAVEPARSASGGKETVLLVEDEPALRRLAIRILSRLGYTIYEAGSGVEALKVWADHSAEIHLLLTDIVMPDGINGLDLARQLQASSPRLKVIFMSGYNADVNVSGMELKEGVNFIAKPFGMEKLSEIIRNRLDGRSGG